MTTSQRLLAAFFAIAGAMHFVRTAEYEGIMPPYLPYHHEAVVVSGVAEIAGAAMLIPRRTRGIARWWLLGLLAAVFPANVHMALHPEQIEGLDSVPLWVLWARLPLQPLAMLWVWRATRPGTLERPSPSGADPGPALAGPG